jgi:hypothetical protein
MASEQWPTTECRSITPIRRSKDRRTYFRNPKALAAIHEFLRFQIKDHRTADPLALQQLPGSGQGESD